MPVFNEYHYKPLSAEDEIRCIVLNSARDDEAPLKCSIVQYRRSVQTVDYFAISYAWGEPEFSRNLEIRDNGDVSYLRITPNVDAMLRRLRALRLLRYLWIDAICLNQADKIEKAQQIPAIGRIFGEAKVVHIWLGLEDRLTTQLFILLRQVNLLPEVEKGEMASRVAPFLRKHPGNAASGLRCFVEFFDRPWFSRRWIIQEAYLARQAIAHCGSHSIPLSSLALTATRFQTLDMSSYPIKVMANLRRPTTKPTMLELLWTFQEARCLEPKDRVASLFGLVQGGHGFHLDYNTHWTEIFKQLALSVFRLGDNDTKLQLMLHLFEFGSVCLPSDIDYPSWVPDWSKPRQRDLPYHSFIRNIDTYEPYPTSPGYSAKATLTFHHGFLQIHWNASINGPRGRQVIYATRFGSPTQNEDQKTERVKSVLLELLPPTSNSHLPILAVSSLLEVSTQFQHSGRRLRLKSSPYDDFIRNIIQKLPEEFHTTILDSLRQIGPLLQDFCLFEMKPTRSRYEDSVGYGISSQQILPGDTMIPLWNMNWEHERFRPFLSQEQKSFHTKTMLAVRPIKGQPPQDSTGMPGEKQSIEAGRIVGWAVCVLLKSKSSYEQNLSVDTMWDDDLDGDQRCSMRLV
ncbi:HET-domain-containing protein [Annulohypoxylon bovei var. microspora]|nr:HET-domain-containing protein [Annulohypoxylon bovei var. microspora]